MKQVESVVRITAHFLKFGCFAFGGGWAIVAQMRKQFVEKDGSLTNEGLLDLMSIGRSLPGMMVANAGMMFGYRRCGLIGGFLCAAAMMTPPLIVMIGVTYFYEYMRDNQWMIAAMNGVRPAVVPIIISAVSAMLKSAYKVPVCAAVTAVALALYTLRDVSCLALVLFGAVCGLIISRCCGGKGKEDGNAA